MAIQWTWGTIYPFNGDNLNKFLEVEERLAETFPSDESYPVALPAKEDRFYDGFPIKGHKLGWGVVWHRQATKDELDAYKEMARRCLCHFSYTYGVSQDQRQHLVEATV